MPIPIGLIIFGVMMAFTTGAFAALLLCSELANLAAIPMFLSVDDSNHNDPAFKPMLVDFCNGVDRHSELEKAAIMSANASNKKHGIAVASTSRSKLVGKIFFGVLQ